MSLTAGKIAEVLFENALETHEEQTQMVDLCDIFTPNSGDMQNAGNVIWRNVQQHAPVIDGWDLTGLETGIIEETYPALLGTPKNDFVQVRIDDLRDKGFWERRGRESGMKQAATLNKAIADVILTAGSMYYSSATTSGYEFIAEAQALMNERQLAAGARYFCLNDRDNLTFGSDLAGRQTVQGRPETTWSTGQIGQNVAGFDVYTGSFIGNLAANAASTTCTGNQSFKPEGGSVNTATGTVTNVDYRSGVLAVAASGGFNPGDKVTISNGGTPVKALALTDKTDSGQDMTFTVISAPSGTALEVFPKPIALDDPALSVEEAAHANIDTQILDGATVDVVSGTGRGNLFWCRESIEVTAGDIPAELMAEFDGMKVISETLKSGLKMYMIYDANIATMNTRWRLFTWYAVTNRAPHANGVCITT